MSSNITEKDLDFTDYEITEPEDDNLPTEVTVNEEEEDDDEIEGQD